MNKIYSIVLVMLSILATNIGEASSRAQDTARQARFLVSIPPYALYILEWEDGVSHVQTVPLPFNPAGAAVADERRLLVSDSTPRHIPNVYLLSENGDIIARLTDFPDALPIFSDIHKLAWSEAGRYLLVSAWGSGVFGVDLQQLPARRLVLLTPNGYNAALSHDGRYIAYQEQDTELVENGRFTSTLGQFIQVADLAGGARWTISSATQGACACPEWDPTAYRVAYSCDGWENSQEQATGHVYITDLSNGTTQRIPAGGTCPRWSADGTRILTTGGGNAYILTLSTMHEETIPLPIQDIPEYAPDRAVRVEWFE